jgi:proline iminopeptidase
MADYKLVLLSKIASKDGSDQQNPELIWRWGAVCFYALPGSHTDFDFTTHLVSYTTKVLFLYSELNPSYGYNFAKEVSGAFPNVELAEVKNAGHDMLNSNFNSVIAQTRTYLKEVEGRP